MNKIYRTILYFLFLLLFNSCTNPTEINSNLYSGTWQWLKTVGGLFPRIITPENGVTLKVSFDNSNNYKIFRNDSLKVSANYKIEEVENDWDKISYTNITTYNFNFDRNIEFSEIHSDTLQIWDGMFDGYFSFFKRLQ